MKDNNKMKSTFTKFFPLLLILAMIVSAMPSMIVSAETKTAGSLHYVDVDGKTGYWTDSTGLPVVVPEKIVLEKSVYAYTGKPIKPVVDYVEGSCFEQRCTTNNVHHYSINGFNITYENNINVGTATMYVSDKGNNVTVKQTFQIVDKASVPDETNSNVAFSDRKKLVKLSDKKEMKKQKVSIKKFYRATESFIVKWTNLNIAKAGYEVQYSTKKNMKKHKTLKFTDQFATSTCIQGLKKNTKYYVRVRSYVKSNGKKIYTKWSTVKSVRTAKKAKYFDYPYPVNVVVDEGNLVYWYSVTNYGDYRRKFQGKTINWKKQDKLFYNRYDGSYDSQLFTIKHKKFTDGEIFAEGCCEWIAKNKSGYGKRLRYLMKTGLRKYIKLNPNLKKFTK